MEFLKNDLEGLLIIRPQIFEDPRGHFFESYKKSEFEKNGICVDFVQDNQSCSQKNVLRGLHFQRPPFAQGKLVRVIRGSVLDVAVDIRKNSPGFGKYSAILLSEANKLMYWIPEGFAHGFLTLEDQTILQYKCTAVYNRESEGSIIWNDPDIHINWGVGQPLLSEKDSLAPFLRDIADLPF